MRGHAGQEGFAPKKIVLVLLLLLVLFLLSSLSLSLLSSFVRRGLKIPDEAGRLERERERAGEDENE
jgi:hypothetical protein